MSEETTDIGELLQIRLANASSLRNLVGERIRPDALSDNEQMPAIRYEILSSDSEYGLQGASGEASTRIQYDCYGRTRREANRVAAVVADLLHGYRGALSSEVFVFDCLQDNKYDRRDPPPKGGNGWRPRRVVDFVVTHTEPIPSLTNE